MNSAIHAVLFGTAVGDSLGLPAENLSARQIQRRWPGPWRHRFVFGRGMVSDDTEHTVFVAQCLADGPTDPKTFQRKLAWKLRWWLLGLPAGIGFATLRAVLKLWFGIPPTRSGVFSAGNGPAMRSAPIGAYFAGRIESIREFVRASTRLTHTDPKAETAALAVALTASWSVMTRESSASRPNDIRDHWLSAGPNDADWIALVEKIIDAHERQRTVPEFAQDMGLEKGVTGYSYHSVPVAFYAWLRHFGDYRAGLEAVISCGGDTDTVGAITGALLAINSPIPDEWSAGLCDHPISRHYLEQLAIALESKDRKPPAFHWLALPFRNLFFLAVVLAHLCRRLIPL
jgi:ADP-ribosyl-[dinitrogen reductase] hydrolase